MKPSGITVSAIFIITASLIAVIMSSVLSDAFSGEAPTVGEVSPYTVRSTIDYEVEDRKSTEKERAVAASAVPQMFAFDDSPSLKVENKISEIFSYLKENAKSISEGEISFSGNQKKDFEEVFGVDLVGSEWEIILKTTNWKSLSKVVSGVVKPIQSQGVIANKQLLRRALARGEAILKFKASSEERFVRSADDILSLSEAVRTISRVAPPSGYGKGKSFDGVVRKLSTAFLQTNVTFDDLETKERKQLARAGVIPAFMRVLRGEVIVRAGDVIGERAALKLSYLQETRSSWSVTKSAVGYLVLTTLILAAVYLFLVSNWRRFNPNTRDLCLIATTLVGSFVLIKTTMVLSDALSMAFPALSPNAFLLIAPVAAGGILLQATLGAAGVFLYTISFAFIASVYMSNSASFLMLVLVGNLVGASSVRHCSRRSMFLLAGLRVAGINTLIVLSFMLLESQSGIGELSFRVACVFIGGLISGVLAAGLTPVAEHLGSYITDIKLLELASLDRPLLRDLSIQAAGTWNHSIVMGQMGEAAAESIGASGLLTRVGAYYHDIGKTKKPDYFVENQSGKENRHDKLTPSMSALIIKAHVKDGMEMSTQARLPKAIADFIPQHHGTALIEYFYSKALKESDEEVVESNYRYGGPKPQTKEAGILMLADCVEAAARTLNDPSPAKIQGLVQKMINKVFSSGELDESDLTLKDLHHIAKSFTRVLSGIHHKRVEYSEPAEKGKKSAELQVVDNVNTEKTVILSAVEVEEKSKKEKPKSKEALKRLGIS